MLESSMILNTRPGEFQYQEAFDAVRSTVRELSRISEEQLDNALAKYTFTPSAVIVGSDDDLYKKLVGVVFYSGMQAAKVTSRMSRIDHHFADFRSVASYTPSQIQSIIDDESMLSNRLKINACVNNAKRFVEILRTHKSVADYYNSFGPFGVDGHIMNFRDALIDNFSYLGEITVYHYLMDLGVNVAKPDRVLQRVFHRFGLVGDPGIERKRSELRNHLWDVVKAARSFARATGQSIRYVDINYMAFGQEKIVEFGIEGTCLEDKPKCHLCKATAFCHYSTDKI